MKPRENMMAIFNREQPDYYGDFMAALDFAPDPVFAADSVPDDGLEHRDSWGTVCVKLPGSPGKHPHVTPENAVVKDVTAWREQLKVPALEGLDWSAAREFAAGADRSERFVGLFSAQGLFERSHFLMGMEDAFCAYLEEPEEMADMLRAIADYKIAVLREAARQFQPDVVFFQDDWGSKQNLFLPPTVWRELIKPLHAEIVAAAHECGMLFVHHADCICEPIVEDMVEIGIDIWQGAIPQNDLPAIQERTGGELAIIGGIDAPAVDIEHIGEEEIRAEVRRAIDAYCPAGRFYPSIPSGKCFRAWNDAVVNDELEKYGRRWAREHPILEAGQRPS